MGFYLASEALTLLQKFRNTLFDFQISMTVASAAAILAASAAGLAYVDGLYSISRDVSEFLADRRFGKRLNERLRRLGTHVTMYHLWELADPSAEALWFEGRAWTFAEAKRGDTH
jgi:hypothetical protein